LRLLDLTVQENLKSNSKKAKQERSTITSAQSGYFSGASSDRRSPRTKSPDSEMVSFIKKNDIYRTEW